MTIIEHLKQINKLYSTKQKLRLLFIMLPLKGLYYFFNPCVWMQNIIIDKYNELDEKYSKELFKR